MSDDCFKTLLLKSRYATNRDDLVEEFYQPTLDCAVCYDRAVGYFHSSLLLLVGQAIADLAQRGGKIRLVCSPELTQEDIDAIQQGYQWHDTIGVVLSRFIDQILGDVQAKPMMEFVATLIAIDCLDIRVAFRPGAVGIFHDKVGILHDEHGDAISFSGSSNESWRAWDPRGNHESFDVFCSWTAYAGKVIEHAEYFESLWNGNEPGLEVIHFPEIARDRLVAIANTEGVGAAYRKVVESRPRTRMQKAPQPYQVEAIASWEKQGYRGILEFATGAGKTFTAIMGMREWLKAGKPVIVLVPSKLLLQQWHRELLTELADLDPKILLAGADNTAWRNRDLIEGYTAAQGEPRIVLATMQTASSAEFIRRVQVGSHLLLIADEVHRIGSAKLSNALSINAGARLGLSATPRRYGDPEGTRKIFDYFGNMLEPPFTLADAIAAGRLCRYTYHIHTVSLNDDETQDWRQLTTHIRQRVAKIPKDKDGARPLSEDVKMLLIRRAGILKRATAKVQLAADVLKKAYESGQRWLVYCDDTRQLGEVLHALRGEGLPAEEYHSAMLGDGEAALLHFTVMGGILVAIRCLDEGVDIPTVDHALILASSRNPREFIQRRGRVLRTAPDKIFAEIHDALVLPPIQDPEADDVAILRGEIARALKFAESATNEAVLLQLQRLARENGMQLAGTASAGFEDEEEGEDE